MSKPKKKGARKPAPKNKGGRPRKRWLDDYASVGPPPADPLARQKWLGDVLAVAMAKVLADPGISEETRLTRIRQLSKDLRASVPDERRWLAEQRILAFEKRTSSPSAPSEGSEELSDAAADDQPIRAPGPGAGGGGAVRRPADGIPRAPDEEQLPERALGLGGRTVGSD